MDGGKDGRSKRERWYDLDSDSDVIPGTGPFHNCFLRSYDVIHFTPLSPWTKNIPFDGSG